MADAGSIYFNALSGVGSDIANSMLEYHKEHQAHDQAYGVADALSRIGIDKNTGQPVMLQFDEKGKPMNAENVIAFGNPKAIEGFKNFNRQKAAANEGAMNALSRIMASGLTRAQAAAIEDASLSGQHTKQVIDQERELFPIKKQHLQAETEHIRQATAGAKAEAEQPTVMMDIGGGNMIQVPAGELIKHPDFLKNVKPKEINEAVLNSTGFHLPEVQQAWNKRVVNGQLQFEMPVPVTIPNPVTGAPIPQLNKDNTPAYEQIPNKKFNPQLPISTDNPKTVSRTNTFNIPADLTPDVLRIIGTKDISGASDALQKAMETPSKQVGGVSVVPNSVRSPRQDSQTVAQQVIQIYNSKPPNQRTAQDEAAYQKALQILGQ